MSDPRASSSDRDNDLQRDLNREPLGDLDGSDPHIVRLADLFAHHPTWREAMNRLRTGVSSTVYFSHHPDSVWHFVKTAEGVRLRSGPAVDPDFAFCFTPAAIDLLAERSAQIIPGAIDEVAVTLFDLMLSDDPARRIGFCVLAPFWRLARHGHLGLLVAAGPRVVAYGAAHGIRSLGQLRAFVATLRASSPDAIAPRAGGC